MKFRAAQAAVALLLLAAMVEGGSIITGEGVPWNKQAKVAAEYQRYPGHPASTGVSPVVGDTVYRNLNGSDWAPFTEYINQLSSALQVIAAIQATRVRPPQ